MAPSDSDGRPPALSTLILDFLHFIDRGQEIIVNSAVNALTIRARACVCQAELNGSNHSAMLAGYKDGGQQTASGLSRQAGRRQVRQQYCRVRGSAQPDPLRRVGHLVQSRPRDVVHRSDFPYTHNPHTRTHTRSVGTRTVATDGV